MMPGKNETKGIDSALALYPIAALPSKQGRNTGATPVFRCDNVACKQNSPAYPQGLCLAPMMMALLNFVGLSEAP